MSNEETRFTAKNRPQYRAIVFKEVEGGEPIATEVGAAWESKSGECLNLSLGRITLVPAKETKPA